MQKSTATDASRAQQLSSALTQVDQFVQQGCAEMSSIAQLALVWLEVPEGCRHVEVVARALQSIRNCADALADYAGSEAREMGCGFDDPAEQRRADASRAAAKAVAHLFEGRASVSQRTQD